MDDATISDMTAPAAGRGRSLRRAAALFSAFPHLVTIAALAAFSFNAGGYFIVGATPVVLVYAAAMALWSLLAPQRLVVPRTYLVALGAFALFAVWNGVSIWWSIAPDRSWVAFDYAVLYLVVLWVAGSSAAGPAHLRLVTYGYLTVAAAVAVYAGLGKALPDVVRHAHLYARLDQPVGYWNVLALMMVMALPIALHLGARRAYPPLLRAVAAPVIVLLSLVFFFTFSRGGFLALFVCLIVYFLLADARLSSFLSLLCGVLPALAALWTVRHRATLFTATANDQLRTVQGHALLRAALVALLVALLAQSVVAVVDRRYRFPRIIVRALGIVVVTGLVAGVIVGPLVYLSSRGGAVHWARQHYETLVNDSDPQRTGDSPSRVLSMATGRPPLWREGLDQFRRHPLAGAGAGSFPLTHYRFRDNQGVVKNAHSEWINILSELGIVGLVLFVCFVGGLLASIMRRFRKGRHDPLRGLVAAIQAGSLAFLLHLSWDWDWEMPAVTVAFLLLAGTAASYLGGRGRSAAAIAAADESGPVDDAGPVEDPAPLPAVTPPRGLRFGWPARTLTCGLIALWVLSWCLPYLALQAESKAVDQAGKGNLETAVAAARRAHQLDPLAVDSLITLAQIEQRQGNAVQALADLRRAQQLQPQNWEVYLQLALCLSTQFGRDGAAAAELRKGLALNPQDASMLYLLGVTEGR